MQDYPKLQLPKKAIVHRLRATIVPSLEDLLQEKLVAVLYHRDLLVVSKCFPRSLSCLTFEEIRVRRFASGRSISSKR